MASHKKLPPEYLSLLDKLETTERAKVESLLNEVLQAVREPTIADLWEQPELAVTYWILLSSGLHQTDELEIARTLSLWKVASAKDSAMLLCIQHSDREKFKCCSAEFGVVKTPTLILGDSSEMKESILIAPQLLFSLASREGALERFLTEIHSSIVNGNSLRDIDRQLRTERFWASMKLVYSEIRDLISLKIG